MKERYWGMAAFATVWIVTTMMLRGIFGGTTSYVGIMWFFIIWHAVKGYKNAIINTAKWSIWLQIIGGLIGFIWLSNDAQAVKIAGYDAEELAIGIGFATIPWVVLYYWAGSKTQSATQTSSIKTVDNEKKGSSQAEKNDPDQTISGPNAPMTKSSAKAPPPPTSQATEIAKDSASATLEPEYPKAVKVIEYNATSPNPHFGDSRQKTLAEPVQLNDPTMKSKLNDVRKMVANEDGKFTAREKQHVIALKVLEYRSDAEIAWKSLQSLPKEFQFLFLDALEDNPNEDAARLASALVAEHKRELRPYDNEEANDALEQARTISQEAADEFVEVYRLLGASLNADNILSKIEKKFGLSERTAQAERIKREREERERIEKQRIEQERLKREREERVRVVREAFLTVLSLFLRKASLPILLGLLLLTMLFVAVRYS